MRSSSLFIIIAFVLQSAHRIRANELEQHALFAKSIDAAKAQLSACKSTESDCRMEEYAVSALHLQHSLAEKSYLEPGIKHIESKPVGNYNTFFLDYELTGRIGLWSGSSDSWTEEFLAQLRECIDSTKNQNGNEDPATQFIRWKTDCHQEHASAWPVAAFVMNNYLVRMPSELVYNAVEDYVDYRNQWPLTRFARAGQGIGVNVCPHGLHGLITVQQGNANMRVLEPAALSNLQPDFSAVSHIPVYNADMWATEHPIESFTEFGIEPGAVVYVPPGHAYAALSSDGDFVLTETCYLDAANLNNFREALAVEAIVSPHARELKKILTAGVKIDLQMDRDVSNSVLAHYFSWPRTTLTSALEDDELQQQQQHDESGRNRRDKKSFRDWQEQSRWNSITTGLTLPLPDAPDIKAFARQDVHMEWYSSYRLRDDDSTPAGYQVTIQEEHDGGPSTSTFVKFYRHDLTETPDITRSSEEAFPVYKYEAVVSNLTADTTYRFRIALFYDDSEGQPSLTSSQVTTLPLTPPTGAVSNVTIAPDRIRISSVVVEFNPPDDGGHPILGYHAFSQRHSDTTSMPWTFVGDFKSTVKRLPGTSSESMKDELEITDLLPDTTYRIKLIAFNELGDSMEHGATDLVTTLKGNASSTQYSLADAHVKGVGHPSRMKAGGPHSSTSNVVTINDKTQKVISGDQAFEVWTCHWSPRTFQVSAEAVWVEPNMVDSAISNENAVNGRIAIVRRGKVAFVTKVTAAQAAGALGVIVVDDGRCTGYNQVCLPGAEKKNSELFAMRDMPKPWLNVKIPVVFTLESTGRKLMSHAQVKSQQLLQGSGNDEL